MDTCRTAIYACKPVWQGRACRRAPAPLLWAALAWCFSITPSLADDPAAGSMSGPELFRQHCAECHGAAGEGTDEHYPRPLVGELPVAELASFIAASMPPDMPGSLGDTQAEQIASFVHAEFYSADAQQKRKRLRPELSRLTGRQYTCMLADLMVSFYDPPAADPRMGLEGSYAAIDADGNGHGVFSRVDPVVRFDFGTSSPEPEKIQPAQFAISWSGSVRAAATGQYEFIVRSPNSFRLYVNSKNAPPLIDAWIQSGDQTEYRGTITLVAGRSYPLQLHFTKAGQGVKKTETQLADVAPAAISLSWVPPGRAEEMIPARCLSPSVSRETLVIQTRFPPDDRSTGFERGTSVSPEWDQATTQAAIECADYVLPRLGDLCGVVVPDAQHVPALREFCQRFAERAFRSPLTPEQQALYIDRQFESAPDPATALQRMVMLVLKSPRFLYDDLPRARPQGYATASRLSLALWDSLPDNALLGAAASGQLTTREQIAAQAQRMVADPRATAKLREFLLQWLKADRLHELHKDAELFPQFDATTAADLRTSLELFIEDTLADPHCNFRSLLLADHLHVNRRLALLYGVSVEGDEVKGADALSAAAPSDSQFFQVKLPAGERAGVLTHPYLLAVLADSSHSSPIRRGVFLARNLLGRVLRPPPDAVTPLVPSLHPDLTTRERAALQTSSESCQACHSLINPLGFTLENFDALGRTRASDNERSIDSSGHYRTRSGEVVRFDGPRALAEFLAGSDEAHRTFIEKLFYFSIKHPAAAWGPEALPRLKREFVSHDFDLRHLLAEIATTAALPDSKDSPVSPDTKEN